MRYIVIAAVQLGIWGFIESVVLPKIHDMITAIAVKFGISAEEAKDVLANDILEFGEQVGIFALTMKSKMPLKLAEFFGFTTKGWSKRVLSTKVTGLGASATKWITGLVKGAPAVEKAAAPAIIAAATKNVKGFKVAYDLLLKTLGLGFVGTLAISNVIDFGNWNSGAYQKTMQKVIAFLSLGTLKPDQDYREAKTLSPEVFQKVFDMFKIEGATAITDPYKGISVAFTRDNMLDFLDVVGAELLRIDGSAATKEVISAALPFIVFNVQESASVATQAVSEAKSVPQVKVFTGVVTQGKLGEAGAFVSRETDLIDDIDELQRSAENNLASFIVALPGLIVYEIKVVSSVTTKDGFTQRGTTQKIVSGYFANGSPKYKTVTNKFAQLNVYAVTEKGTRTKVKTINLGPVNAATFVPTGEQLQLAEKNIKQNITTTDVSEIQTIVSPTEILTEAPKSQAVVETPKYDFSVNKPVLNQLLTTIPVRYYIQGGVGTQFFVAGVVNTTNTPYDAAEVSRQTAIDGIEKTAAVMRENRAKQARGEYVNGPTGDPEQFITEQMANINRIPDPLVAEYIAPWGEKLSNVPLSYVRTLETGGSTVEGLPISNNPNKCFVGSIAEFFDVNKTSYPKLEERAKLYEEWGLGSAAYYVGTAEQNSKWLAELKRRSGC
ncbi:MAG: hypothetical protein WC325_10155 [Candidatus Bathyarchaeia archaeon]